MWCELLLTLYLSRCNFISIHLTAGWRHLESLWRRLEPLSGGYTSGQPLADDPLFFGFCKQGLRVLIFVEVLLVWWARAGIVGHVAA